jgi:hypothetical protein
MVQPKTAQNTAENYLPHLVPNGHASKEVSFVPENFFIEAEIAKPGEKKEEKIVITTSETDALYN